MPEAPLLAGCPYPQRCLMLTVPMAALCVWMSKTKKTSWGVASCLCLCWYHSLLHVHPLAQFCLFLNIQHEFPEPLYPPLSEICLLQASPALLLPYSCSAWCYNCLLPWPKTLIMLILAFVEHLMWQDIAHCTNPDTQILSFNPQKILQDRDYYNSQFIDEAGNSVTWLVSNRNGIHTQDPWVCSGLWVPSAQLASGISRSLWVSLQGLGNTTYLIKCGWNKWTE